MKSLIIAEKPELAKSIVNAIDGKLNKNDGYFEKGNYVVTWAYGHILRLKTPEEYDKDNKSWDMKQLPIYFKKRFCLAVTRYLPEGHGSNQSFPLN